MEATQIFPGCYYITDGTHALLSGCPPEIVKVLRQRDLQPAQFILLPDSPVAHGESQVAVEFPLYYYLFGRGRSKIPPPLQLIGGERRVTAARALLQLTLFGPDEATMAGWGVAPMEAEALARETRWFQPKAGDGRPLAIEDLVEGKVMGEDETDLGWIRLRRVRKNVFRFTAPDWEQVVDLNFSEEQVPPYPVRPDLNVSSLVKLGVEILGGATGFSSLSPSSGAALCYNGNYFLIDSIPFLNHHLRARGIARNQVQALFLTHVHDDHCNMVSLLQYNRRIQVITHPLVYRMALRKLALTMDRAEESLEGYFTLVPLEIGRTLDYFGLCLTAFWSSHSIPTIGAVFETRHAGAAYNFIYTGDTQALADIKRMQRAGVITMERANGIAELYSRPTQLLVADGGEGAIHGDPADALHSPAERIVFLHLDRLSDRFNAQFSIATSGKRYTIVRGTTDYDLTRTIEFLLEYFPSMPPLWISNLLANQQVLSFNAGDIIIRQGSRSEGNVYMILTGYAQVVQHDGEHRNILAQMEAGELMGEMSIITGRGQRNASVVALSPVTVTAIAETAFHGFIRHQNLEQGLRKMWQNRELLQGFSSLRQLQQPVFRALSESVTLEHLPALAGRPVLSRLVGAGGLIFPLGSAIAVDRAGSVECVEANTVPVWCHDDARLVMDAEMPYLALSPEQAASLRRRIPAFRFFWEESLRLPVPTNE